MIFTSHNVKETQKIAADLARKIIKTKKGAVIALKGELGAGKTVFVRGFAKALGVKSKIKSPTFVLMKKYPVKLRHGASKVSGGTNLYHLDCYRIDSPRDLKIPELKEILTTSHNHNILLIEWAERIQKILPKKRITVHIDHVDKNVRKIKIDNF
jgi:tRNA threonylcarbamoyladenosine biosynthesis protein TsaE